MFKFDNQVEPTALEKEIARLHESLEKLNPEDAKYATVSERIQELYAIASDKDSNQKKVSPDVLVQGAVSILGIFTIVAFEKLGNGIITTKAFGLLGRNKI